MSVPFAVYAPFAGPLTRMKVKGRLFGSLPVSVMAFAVFSVAATDWPSATGGWFVTVTVMSELLVPPILSVIV